MHGNFAMSLGLSDKIEMEKKFIRRGENFGDLPDIDENIGSLPMPMAGYLLSTHEVQL